MSYFLDRIKERMAARRDMPGAQAMPQSMAGSMGQVAMPSVMPASSGQAGGMNPMRERFNRRHDRMGGFMSFLRGR